MKFTQQLDFNTIPEWKDFYIDYNHLKARLYEEELCAKTIRITGSQGADEVRGRLRGVASTQSLVNHQDLVDQQDADFESALDSQTKKVVQFFIRKKEEVAQQIEGLEEDISAVEGKLRTAVAEGAFQTSPIRKSLDRRFIESAKSLARSLTTVRKHQPPRSPELASFLHKESADPESAELTPLQTRASLWLRGGADYADEQESFRDRIAELYQTIEELVEYRQLNLEGFRKIIKKHDKVLMSLTSNDNMMETVFPAIKQAFEDLGTGDLEAKKAQLADHYAAILCNSSRTAAATELRRQLKSRLVFDRVTVWKQMVEKERERSLAHVEDPRPPRRWYIRYWQLLALTLCLSVFITLLNVPTFKEPEQRNCAALLAFVSLLWCTEALPLFATSMLVPGLVVYLQVLVDRSGKHDVRLDAPAAASVIFKSMMSQVIMLLLASCAIAAALTKHEIAKWMASTILSRVGNKPSRVLLANMFVATLASMWISNVAAPVLCYGLLQPILRILDAKDPLGKSLVLGVALASNLGGMTSPIASPQNLFALQQMSIDGHQTTWMEWFSVALPVAFCGVFVCWGMLLLAYRSTVSVVRELHKTKDAHFTLTQWYVIGVSVATVVLWCFNGKLTPVFGEMGVIAIFPLVAFFGFGILSKDDFANFPWNVVMLAMGGMALGTAVDSSGLLLTIAKRLETLVESEGAWAVLAIFCALVLFATTFISHTVGAIIILPIVRAVGDAMGPPHPRMLVMGAALMCSGAMGLPVSGFPNMNAISQENNVGRAFLRTLDFVTVGVPCSIFTYGIIISLGYALMKYVNQW